MSHTGKDDTWNRLFRSDPNFAKDGKGRTITGDYDRGWYAALDEAREAVEALESNPDLEIDWDRDHTADPSGNTRNARIWLRDALAAIDALRGES